MKNIKEVESSESSQLSFHESSIDEEQLYEETMKSMKDDVGFKSLMNRYLNRHGEGKNYVKKKAKKVMKEVQSNKNKLKRVSWLSADRIVNVNK